MVENPFNRKAIFIHKTANVKGGDPISIASMLADAGFEAVYVKAADGNLAYAPNGVINLGTALVNELKKRGIIVIGWGFNYGRDVPGEANIAAAQVDRLGLDGWIFDVETEFEGRPNAVDLVNLLFDTYHSFESTPAAFCSWFFWRNPTNGALWHNEAMAKAAMLKADIGMPMIYWQGTSPASAVWYLRESLRQWGVVTNKPLIPTGRAYDGDGALVNADAVTAFANEVKVMGLPGISWWFMDQAHLKPDVWARLAAITKFGPIITPGIDYQPQIDELRKMLIALDLKVNAIGNEVGGLGAETEILVGTLDKVKAALG